MNLRNIVALLLSVCCLSSCHSSVYQYVWQRAKVADKVAWVPKDANVELYRVGGAVYAKGYLGPARGCYKGCPLQLLDSRIGGGHKTLCPDADKAVPAYFRLYDSSVQQVLAAEKKGENRVSLMLDVDMKMPWESLPAEAQLLSVRGENNYHIIVGGHTINYLFNQDSSALSTDAHKYYAYPLAVLTAVAVDVPLTLAANATLVAGVAVATPVGAVCSAVSACAQCFSGEEEEQAKPSLVTKALQPSSGEIRPQRNEKH